MQRRHLEASQPAPVTAEPVHAWTTEPDWLQPWRHTLTQRHAGLLDERQAGHERRRDAARQLVELQPALTAAQAAWQPFQDRIDELDHQLREELRPAMWKANHDACHAGFGHRHRTNRHAQTANDTVRHAEAQADAIRHDASPIKAHLDHVQATATRLRDHAAGPSPIVTRFADQQLDHLERLIDAIDTWTGWNTGRTVTTSHVVASLDTLTRAARHAPAFALDDNQITSSQLAELTQPLATWLNDRSHHQAHRHLSRDLDRSVDFGIDL